MRGAIKGFPPKYDEILDKYKEVDNARLERSQRDDSERTASISEASAQETESFEPAVLQGYNSALDASKSLEAPFSFVSGPNDDVGEDGAGSGFDSNEAAGFALGNGTIIGDHNEASLPIAPIAAAASGRHDMDRSESDEESVRIHTLITSLISLF